MWPEHASSDNLGVFRSGTNFKYQMMAQVKVVGVAGIVLGGCHFTTIRKRFQVKRGKSVYVYMFTSDVMVKEVYILFSCTGKYSGSRFLNIPCTGMYNHAFEFTLMAVLTETCIGNLQW